MSAYLLDTNILIDLASAKKSARYFEKLQKAQPRLRLTISVLSITEFLTGADKFEEKFLNDWLESGEIEVLFVDSVALAKLAAELRREHRMRTPDAMILATAVQNHAHLLTSDASLIKTAKALVNTSNPMV